jgi:hypothetical protein
MQVQDLTNQIKEESANFQNWQSSICKHYFHYSNDYRSKGVELTCEKLLEDMHNQWWIAGNKSQDKKESNNEDEVAVTATTKDKDGEKKNQYVNPDKDKMCNHCKKKGQVESKRWKKNQELIPNKVKAARKKQAEK